MYQIELDHLCKAYGRVQVLNDITINVETGSFVALVGPSGCGKSTLLRSIAGLDKITSGTIRIGGEVVNDRPPRERDIAMVFQSYALYPHMSVERNMTYSLRLRHRPKAEIRECLEATAQTLGLAGLLGRMPRDLSGGQRQRVAMGRAIVRKPRVFLFDEPLSNLDAALRVQMRSEIRRLHKRLEATSVYVTHDQIEAMTMADTVVVLRSGSVEQIGAPRDLYCHPANRFVAGFIGSPAMNFLKAKVTADGLSAALELADGQTLTLPEPQRPGRPIWLGLRPEHMEIGDETRQQHLQARVESVESTGSMSFIETKVAAVPLVVTQSGMPRVQEGMTVTIGINTNDIYAFDMENEVAL
ncbi:sn-glycerol-3-phosphate ABC transporter ATP-binding protein UgpC [Telmatospirillum sp.]|uniref:ABC transporter ATP-binding protein n=1 Tax=Telmatospirillum sp. TaxID=2079197 RepID=UPI00284B7E25|nr:sn-glycerol-3-phosphate ABC transporter ATP-binding protein UgpC [Telmatospirillum sp.]MDR3441199.1 sn-glycerol-3-phosphate ABC transporter ATP-binding protein UgpC [Telmatospirillum sp.]